MARRKQIVPAGRVMEYTNGEPELYLTKPARSFGYVELIRFASRKALEAFNVRANLSALVRTEVPRGCAVYRHEVEIPS